MMEGRFVYLVSLFVGVCFGAGLFMVSGGGSNVESFDAYFEVGDVPAVNNDVEYFDFGELPAGGGEVKKFIDIEGKDFAQLIHVEASGPIAEFVEVSDNDFVVGAGELASLTIRVSVSEDVEAGNYDGKINFYYSNYEG